MKKFLEKIVTGVITCSGFLSSFIILLIVIFLFSEGFGLFSQKTIEDGYSLLVNKENPVNELDAKQIKEIFDEDVTNWKQVGGNDEAITLVRFDDLPKLFSPSQLGENYERAGICIDSLVNSNKGIIAFMPSSFVEKEFTGKKLSDHKISVKEVFTGKEWFPTATPAPQFGFVPLVLGTVWVTVFAILFALPFGLAVSIYMSEVASERMRKVLKPVIELLNGIPSVVYGFFGLIVIVPLLQDVFGLPVGESGLAGALVLAIMALPTIITVSQDAMMNCPRSQREASLALGATRWQTTGLIIRELRREIYFCMVTGFGRSISEVGAVMLVGGNIRGRTRTMTTTISLLKSQGIFTEGVALGILLLLMAFVLQWICDMLQREEQEDENY